MSEQPELKIVVFPDGNAVASHLIRAIAIFGDTSTTIDVCTTDGVLRYKCPTVSDARAVLRRFVTAWQNNTAVCSVTDKPLQLAADVADIPTQVLWRPHADENEIQQSICMGSEGYRILDMCVGLRPVTSKTRSTHRIRPSHGLETVWWCTMMMGSGVEPIIYLKLDKWECLLKCISSHR